MTKYLVIIEKADDGSYSAYVPDIPGCVSCGDNLDEVKKSIKEAIDFHIEGLREEGLAVPEPKSDCEFVEAAA